MTSTTERPDTPPAPRAGAPGPGAHPSTAAGSAFFQARPGSPTSAARPAAVPPRTGRSPGGIGAAAPTHVLRAKQGARSAPPRVSTTASGTPSTVASTTPEPAAVNGPPTTTSPTARAPRLVARPTHAVVEVTDLRCSALEDTEDHSLGVTYWFDAEPVGEPYPVTVHLSGKLRSEAAATPSGAQGQRRATVQITTTVKDVLPGSGRVAVTTRIPKLEPGDWDVVATPVRRAPEGAPAPWVEVSTPLLLRGTASGRTGFSPFVRGMAPGVRLVAWPALVGTGFVAALVVQATLARQLDLSALRLLLLTVVASGLGLLSAKVYYVLTHPGERRALTTAGMSVQGFVIATITTLLIFSPVLRLPLGEVLDVTAPGLLFGMAIGRLGCLLGGCCVGRPTTSRWGVWSSDRRVGVRRIPVQLLESSLSALLGTLALLAVVLLPTGRGLVLVATIAAYVVGRQVLFPLRHIPRSTTHGRLLSLVVAGLTLPASVAGLFFG